MDKHLGLIATVVPLLIVGIGLIGWVLSLRSDVTTAIKQQEVLEERTESLQTRLNKLEKNLAIADDQMKTIMGDHEGFNDVLKELGQAGLLPSGERRAYGGYGN
jgi:alkylation response protein AidB-like acyl-CoA dehydrogenase